MWKSQSELINSERIQRICIFESDRQITYSEVIQLWQQDSNFREFFISLLAEASMTAYFWETPPITESTVDKKFEFVLVNSPRLANVRPDKTDFSQYFAAANKEVVTFPNLGRDALLVVPCPTPKTSAYTHLASFVREAPKSQQHLLWQTVGNELQQSLDEQPVWVSTSGLGVHWLHVRLDSTPKYYCFEPYKQTFERSI